MPKSTVKTIEEIIKNFEDILRMDGRIHNRLSTDSRYLSGMIITRSLSLLGMLDRYELLIFTFLDNLKQDILCDDRAFFLRFMTHAKMKLHTSLSLHILRLIDDTHLWDPRPSHLQAPHYVFFGGIDEHILKSYTNKMIKVLNKLSAYKAQLEHELSLDAVEEVGMDSTTYSFC